MSALDERPPYDPERYEALFLILACTFTVLLVLTNVIGLKLFYAPFYPGDEGFALTAGILTYPLTFLVTDVTSEVFGKRRADRLVAVGFAMTLLMLGVVQLAMWVEPHPYWVPQKAPFYQTASEYQHAFESVFSIGPVLVFASMSAYLCAQLCDNYLFHFWKRMTKGKHLWIRNNGSTLISQAVDTIVVGHLLFLWGMGMPPAIGYRLMATVYVYKLCIALLDTPFVYAGVYAAQRFLRRS